MNQTTTVSQGSRRLRTSYLSTVVSITLVLWMLGILGLLLIDSKKISDYFREHVQLTVFLHDEMAEADIREFQNNLNSLPFIRSARYVSKDEALDSLKKDLGEGALSMLESNPLPSSIDIRLNAAYAQVDSLKKIQDLLMQNKFVREVTYQQGQVNMMSKNLRTVALVILVFCGLLFFIAIALINNTIRLSMYANRFLIKSMQLVGATKNFIRWPFLKRGLVQGFYAGLLSCLLLSGVIYLIHTKFPELDQLSDYSLIAWLFATVITLGFFLSGLSSFFAVNRYLRLRSAEIN